MDKDFSNIQLKATTVTLGDDTVMIKYMTLPAIKYLARVGKEVENFAGIVDALLTGKINSLEDLSALASLLIESLAKDEVLSNYLEFLSHTTDVPLATLKNHNLASIIFLSKHVFKENWDFLAGSLGLAQTEIQA